MINVYLSHHVVYRVHLVHYSNASSCHHFFSSLSFLVSKIWLVFVQQCPGAKPLLRCTHVSRRLLQTHTTVCVPSLFISEFQVDEHLRGV